MLEHVEQEQRQVGVRPGGHIRHRRHAAQPRVQLTQVQLVAVEVREDVDLEEPAVALLAEARPEPLDELARPGSVRGREHVRVHVVAAPPAGVRRQLRTADQVRHERADKRAV